MEKLLEYARVTFEERYMCKTMPFDCVRPQVEKNFCRCICMPGVAMNFIACVLDCCYEEFCGKSSISWNANQNIYLPEHEYNTKKIVVNFQTDAARCECYYTNDLCNEGINTFSYIKIRSFDVLRNTYLKQEGIQNGFNKDKLLFGKTEKFDNSMDYLRLFCLIAESNRGSYDMNDYAEKLFRLFFFLFPYTGFEVIERNLMNHGEDKGFAEYHKRMLEEYEILGKGKQREDTMASSKISITIEQLKEFCGFDFWSIYKRYESSGLGGGSQSLKDILKKQMSICGMLSGRTKQVRENMNEIIRFLEENAGNALKK